jgi:hypothetical protein
MARNTEYEWNSFDPEDYLEHNYATLRDDDRQILQILRDFFCRQSFDPGTRGVDVGTGTNLYPALAMLPFCSTISMLEYSEANIDWLRHQVLGYSPNWESFWAVLTEQQDYRTVTGPRDALRLRADIRKWNILKDDTKERWDVGTMFFVAESITTDWAEFSAALIRFCQLLKPGAPFVATFMENSRGYDVGGLHFPALSIDRDDVDIQLSSLGNDLTVHRFGIGDAPLRSGYSGMLLAHGYVK